MLTVKKEVPVPIYYSVVHVAVALFIILKVIYSCVNSVVACLWFLLP